MVLMVWAVAVAGVLFTAMDTRTGPVHGVHLADVLVLLAAAAIAAVLTWLLLRKPPPANTDALICATRRCAIRPVNR
jgi:hypothetical protein